MKSEVRSKNGSAAGRRPGAIHSLHCLISALWLLPSAYSALQAQDLRAGAASVELEADDSMVLSGGIGPRYGKGQEGKLRVTAVVVSRSPAETVVLAACDVLFVTRDLVDPALMEIEKKTGIPPSHVLINATHTHSAPSTTTIHGYDREEVFCDRLKRAMVEAVVQAHGKLTPATASFRLGEEKTVGQNSRLRLSDNTIFWTGDNTGVVGPSDPFDPQLPVLAFRGADQRLLALVYNHSTHTMGTRSGEVRSPSFYGLAAQELEQELGGSVCFLEGASGSTHNLTLNALEASKRIKAAVKKTLNDAQPLEVDRIAAIRRPFRFKVRVFDEAVEDEKVVSYCRKRIPDWADKAIGVFRGMRKALKAEQGRERETFIQAVRIGDLAVVGVPAEYFTVLGMDIKRRSPFRHTVVAELAGDWIGYLPDRRGHRLGGYQTWMGQHSYAEVGTGERMTDEAVELLKGLK